MTAFLQAVMVFSIQVAIVIAAALAIAACARIRVPKLLLAHYQVAALLAFLAPVLSLMWSPASTVFPGMPTVTIVETASAVTARTPPLLLTLVAWSLVLGSSVRVIRFLQQCGRLRRMRTSGRRLETGDSVFGRMEDTIGVRARWIETAAVRSPATYGWRRPIVLVPEGQTRDTDACRMMFAHELIHVRRRDWLFVLMEELAGALLWFHPGVWLLRDRLHLYREQVVDRETVAVMGQPEIYAFALVESASLSGSVESPLAPAWRTARHLRARIVAVTEGGTMSKTRTRIWQAAMAAAIAVASVTVARAVPLAPATDAPAQETYEMQTQGLTPPKVVTHPAPMYTSEAMKAKIEGELTLSVVVKSDGSVGQVDVLQSLDQTYGLDEQGIATVRQWTFEPGTKDGKPVNVRVSIVMRFTLK